MTDESPSEDRPTNDASVARKAARDKARQLRTSQRKKDRRNRALLRSGIIVGLIAVAAIVAIVIVTSIRPPHRGPANMASDGVLIGQGLKAARSPARAADAKPTPHPQDTTGQLVNIVSYVDYLCQYCGQFERANDAQIQKLVSSGAATIEIHPLPYYSNRSAQGTQYSLRAANAAACVANYAPDRFFAFNRVLFAHEPNETSAGPTDARIKDFVAEAGATSRSAIDRCIDDRTYSDWAQDALTRATTGPLPNSEVKKVGGNNLPLILVDGQPYHGSLTDPADFRTFIQQAQGEQYSTASPTPTPGAKGTDTPTASPTPTEIVVSSVPSPSPTS